jgi:PPK2 family polyphosphate:nucleotide phosphotransferase
MPISLSELSTRAPQELDKRETKQKFIEVLEELDELQNKLYASKAASVLVIAQGMDASGKDSLIRDVAGAMNPQGVQVHSFKVPTEDEAAHDFLWRIHQKTPARGMIHVFNRSHYEDVLVPYVHKTLDVAEARSRMEHINAFEKLLLDTGTVIVKLYLHVSKEKQLERLKDRTEDPRKMWKYDGRDVQAIESRAEYIGVYEELFERCAAAPWHIIPADQNWYKAFATAIVLRDALAGIKMEYPKLKKEQ